MRGASLQQRQREEDAERAKRKKRPRFSVVRGNFGYRIYDREQKDYHKNSRGLVRWYQIRSNAVRRTEQLNDMWAP